MKLNLVGNSSPSRALVISANRLVNMYAEKGTGDTKEPASLIKRPGLKLHATGAGLPVRGEWKASNGAAFVVIGPTLSMLSGGVLSLVGTLNSAAGRVSIRDNGLQMIVVDGVAGYVVTLATNAFAKITDADFPNGATDVLYIDTYFIVGQRGSQQFFISEQMNGAAWGALDFFAAEGSPDLLVGMIENHREAWFGGPKSFEVWSSTTDSSFPFQRISFVEQGLAAPGSLTKMDNSIFWIGSNESGAGVVYRANGYQPVRVSTHALEYQISKMQRFDDAIGYAMIVSGHSFFVLSFPSAGQTWVFDASTGLWAEWAFLIDGLQTRFRGVVQMFHEGKQILGDYENGKLYELDDETYTDNGTEIVCNRTVRVQNAEKKPVSFAMLEIDAEPGVGLVVGQGADPIVTLRISDDGGHVWNTTRYARLGKIGEYLQRCTFHALGQARDRVFELTFSDPVPLTLSGIYMEAKGNG